MAILETCEDDPPHHAQLSNKTSEVPFRTQEPSFGLIVRVYSVDFCIRHLALVLRATHFGVSRSSSEAAAWHIFNWGPRSNVGSNATENDVSNVLVDSLISESSLWCETKMCYVVET